MGKDSWQLTACSGQQDDILNPLFFRYALDAMRHAFFVGRFGKVKISLGHV